MRKDADGRARYNHTRCRLASEYLGAALPLGLELRRCEEPRRSDALVDDAGTSLYDIEHGNEPPEPHEPGSPPNVWSLHCWAPEATNAAWRGSPAAIVLYFQLAEA